MQQVGGFFLLAQGGNSPIPIGKMELSEDMDSEVVCGALAEQDGATASPLEETTRLHQPASAHRSALHRRPCLR